MSVDRHTLDYCISLLTNAYIHFSVIVPFNLLININIDKTKSYICSQTSKQLLSNSQFMYFEYI